MGNKQYTSVSKMLEDLSDDDQFNNEFDERVAQRRLVKRLIALRAARKVSQADVASALGVTQSRVSKIENGVDDDLRFSELKAYAQALRTDIGITFSDRKRTIADEVKSHVLQIKQALDRLAKCAEGDERIAHGVAAFFGEAFFNVVRIMQESASKLPKRETDGKPHLQIEIQEALKNDRAGTPCEEDDISDSADDDTHEAALHPARRHG